LRSLCFLRWLDQHKSWRRIRDRRVRRLGQAYDHPAETAARAAALKQCKGKFTAVTMKQAAPPLRQFACSSSLTMTDRSVIF
jgi:hypothetical protein